MSFIRANKRRLKDGTIRSYYSRIECYREGGKVRQRVVEYLGTNPYRVTLPLPDPDLAARVAMAVIGGAPSAQELRRRLKALGIDLPTGPQKVSFVYTPPLKRYTLHCE